MAATKLHPATFSPCLPGSMLVHVSRMCNCNHSKDKDGVGRALVAIEGDLCPLRHIFDSDQLLFRRRNTFFHCRHEHFLIAFVLPVSSRKDAIS